MTPSTRAHDAHSATPPRELLTLLYWTAVRAVSPGPALDAALARVDAAARPRRVWVIAVGKAAGAMAAAAVKTLGSWGAAVAGGLVVAPAETRAPHPEVASVVGDHPLPGARSFAAAARLGEVATRVHAGDEAWVLLSGGATSLIAAPEGAVRPDELTALYGLLLGSGLGIADMNVIRKRFSRWGAGRLAAALAPARIRNYIISDVIGDNIGAIGSGPCAPDPSNAAYVRGLLERVGLWERVPLVVRRVLAATEADPALETPKPGDPVFRNVERRIVASNRLALEAVADKARQLGLLPGILGDSLDGEAAAAGATLAATLLSYRAADAAAPSGRAGQSCLIWGGETTVTLGDARGRGGRCQELALAAARRLHGAGAPGAAITLLAAGTDGRDGPTDAAGAIVDGDTWESIRLAGRDPAHDLASHEAYAALDAAGALLRTGLTGTNVMDVVIALRGASGARP